MCYLIVWYFMITEGKSKCSYCTVIKKWRNHLGKFGSLPTIHTWIYWAQSEIRNKNRLWNIMRRIHECLKAHYFYTFKFYCTSKMKNNEPVGWLTRLTACCQIWKPEFNSKESHNWIRELKSTNYPLTSTHMLEQCTCLLLPYPHNDKIKIMKNVS